MFNGLKKLRENYGFTKSEIATYLGVTVQAISKIEKDKKVKVEYIFILSKVYGTSIEELKKAIEKRYD